MRISDRSSDVCSSDLIAAVLPIAAAEREERALLDHYLDALRACGAEGPDRDTAWDDYRAAQIYGYFHWAITRRVAHDVTRDDAAPERKSVVEGKRVSVRVALGGSRIIKKKQNTQTTKTNTTL